MRAPEPSAPASPTTGHDARPRARTGLVLALALALAACTPEPAPATSGPPSVAAEIASPSAFLNAYAERACNRAAACCRKYGSEPLDRDSCLAVNLVQAVPSGGPDAVSAFDATAATQCLQAVSAEPCYASTSDRASACRYVLRPRPPSTARLGEPCGESEACALVDDAAVECGPNPDPIGAAKYVCQIRRAGEEGAACSSAPGADRTGLGCAPTLRCHGDVCVARLGFRCGKNAKSESELACGDGYACFEGACELVVPVGAPCSDSAGPLCDPRDGRCVDGTCHPLQLSGCVP